MTRVTTRCPNDETQTKFLGVELTGAFVAVLVELFAFCYTFYQTCVVVRLRHIPISSRLVWILQLYHICVLTWLLGVFLHFMSSIIYDTDLSSMSSCYQDIWILFPSGMFYALFTLFWSVRLEIVFKGSEYQVSKLSVYIIRSLILISFLTGQIALIICLIQSINSSPNKSP